MRLAADRMAARTISLRSMCACNTSTNARTWRDMVRIRHRSALLFVLRVKHVIVCGQYNYAQRRMHAWVPQNTGFLLGTLETRSRTCVRSHIGIQRERARKRKKGRELVDGARKQQGAARHEMVAQVRCIKNPCHCQQLVKLCAWPIYTHRGQQLPAHRSRFSSKITVDTTGIHVAQIAGERSGEEGRSPNPSSAVTNATIPPPTRSQLKQQRHRQRQQQQLTEPVLNNSRSVMLAPSTPPPTAPLPLPPPFVETFPLPPPPPTPDNMPRPPPPIPREDEDTATPRRPPRSPCMKEGGGIPLKWRPTFKRTT